MHTYPSFRLATVTAALLASIALPPAAHAGLLGGGGLGGGLGGSGGLAGTLGPRQLDASGNAAGETRQNLRLPRADRQAAQATQSANGGLAAQAAGSATGQAAAVAGQATTQSAPPMPSAQTGGQAAANASKERRSVNADASASGHGSVQR